ncbi:MAG: 5'-methylthioadenosine/adenosylhomocysteine nucleosidase [Spirochaetales bacterium]|nr:5'-methylthioadenosine/adenosylhomocysteine nucleosidase [Spirochaetales bacterium]
MSRKVLSVLLIVLVFGIGMAFAQSAVEMSTERIGIISAMDNEIELLLSNAEIDRVDHIGGMDFHVGRLVDKDVVIVKAGIGKVYASAGAANMFSSYNIGSVIFTGIAGGVGDSTKVLDMVVATDLVQHDYGTVTDEGFYWRDEYRMETNGRFNCDPDLVDKAYESAVEILGEGNAFKGTIATGDQFIASSWYVSQLQENFNAIACEMEGASVAAVCDLYNVPFVVIRSMSDKADGVAHETYENMADMAADNSCRIVMNMLAKL